MSWCRALLQERTVLAALALGFALRMALFSVGAHDALKERVELVTPVTSIERVREGVWLAAQGQSPYAGSLFHQSPLVLMLFTPLVALPPVALHAFFALIDVAVAAILFGIAHIWTRRAAIRAEQEAAIAIRFRALSAAEQAKCARVDVPHYAVVPTVAPGVVALLYLFNPLTVLSCLSMSTVALRTALVLASALAALSGRATLVALLLALGAFDSLGHTFTLIPGLLLLLRSHERHLDASVFRILAPAVLATAALVGVCWLSMRSFEFVDEVFGFELLVRDLTPNLGLFWYLFTEMFKEFALFYLCILQYFVFVFAWPLSIRLERHPMVLFWALLASTNTWRAYPAVGDLVATLALVPLLLALVRELKYAYIIFIAWVFVGVLAPIFWHLWIVAGSGNANFFYALNLVHAMAQIHLIVDTVAAVLRRDYLVKRPINATTTTDTKKTQ
jgi:phosphatidylinositol glycan class U